MSYLRARLVVQVSLLQGIRLRARPALCDLAKQHARGARCIGHGVLPQVCIHVECKRGPAHDEHA